MSNSNYLLQEKTAEIAAKIRSSYAQLIAEKSLRTKDAAKHLGISEAELLSAHRSEDLLSIKTLCAQTDKIPELFSQVHRLGPVLAITRNEHIVHEKQGSYPQIKIAPRFTNAVSEEIDLRINYQHWKYVFAVSDVQKNNHRYSLQFFDHAGDAIHKIWLTEESNLDAYHQICKDYLSNHVNTVISDISLSEAEKSEASNTLKNETVKKHNNPFDLEAFHYAWDTMQDTHDFNPMLRRFGLQRHNALKLAGPKRAQQLHLSATATMLNTVASDGQAIMVFVGNPGMIQIHTGQIHRIVEKNGWLNVMDLKFNLHISQSGIAEAWLVRQANSSGTMTALELYDANNEKIALFIGAQQLNENEPSQWRDMLEDLPKLN